MIIKGIDESKIKNISKFKGESLDILDYRLRCYNLFKNMSLPSFGPKIDINFDDILYYEMNDNALTVYIKRIREKIEDDPANPKIIVTVRGIGYKLGDEHVKE